MSANADWRPKRLVRTVLSSIANSKTFGKQMEREAKRRRFGEAEDQSVLGRWSALELVDLEIALQGLHADPGFHPRAELPVRRRQGRPRGRTRTPGTNTWFGCAEPGKARSRRFSKNCDRGRRSKASRPADAPDQDPRMILATTIHYLENNRDRMKYPEYRQAGMPVTTAWMESLVKEMNYRVKGTEMFWNDPEGAEAILQVRAAALCDDDRLPKHLGRPSGMPLHSPASSPKITTQKSEADVHPGRTSASAGSSGCAENVNGRTQAFCGRLRLRGFLEQQISAQ